MIPAKTRKLLAGAAATAGVILAVGVAYAQQGPRGNRSRLCSTIPPARSAAPRSTFRSDISPTAPRRIRPTALASPRRWASIPDRRRSPRSRPAHFAGGALPVPQANAGNMFLWRPRHDLGTSPWPFPHDGDGFHRPHFVKLPSHRGLSDQAPSVVRADDPPLPPTTTWPDVSANALVGGCGSGSGVVRRHAGRGCAKRRGDQLKALSSGAPGNGTGRGRD